MGKVGGWGDEGEWHGYENLLCCEHHPMSGVLLGSTELISQQSFTLHFDECFSLSIGTKYFGTVACLYTVSKLVLFIHKNMQSILWADHSRLICKYHPELPK